MAIAVAIVPLMDLKLENPPRLAAPLGLYSHTVEVPAGARLLFVSGQVPVRPDGSVPTGMAEQADQVYANIVTALAAKGASPGHVIKLTTYLVGDDPQNSVREARKRHLGAHRPASTAVWVRRLVDEAWLIEIDAVALLPGA